MIAVPAARQCLKCGRIYSLNVDDNDMLTHSEELKYCRDCLFPRVYK